MKVLNLSVILTGVLATPAMACDLCSIYSASQASGETGRGFYAGLAEQYTDIATLQDSGHKIPNVDGEYIHSSVAQLFAGYNLNSRLSLQLNLPLIHRSYAWTGYHSSEFGPGDLSLIGNYLAYIKLQEDFTFTWSVLGGIKFPTGNTSWLGPRGDAITALGIGGHDLALGSGSFDGVVGTGVYGRWKKMFLTANTQYAIRTKGDFGHRYANDLTWSGGPGYYFALSHKYTLAFQAVVSGEYKAKDSTPNGPDLDSAETIVYVGPQINFTWKNKLSAQIGADLPVSIYNSDVQVVPDYRVHAAVTWRF
jgi:hypothetical protein